MRALGALLALAIVATSSLSGRLLADEAATQECCSCCDRCGQFGACCRVCRVVRSTKKVTKNVYHTKCEDFCVRGPSDRTVCVDECGRRKVVQTPNCGEVHSRRILIKEEVTTEKPSHKCVVEKLCSNCAACDLANAKRAASAPTAAAIAAAPTSATSDGAPEKDEAPEQVQAEAGALAKVHGALVKLPHLWRK